MPKLIILSLIGGVIGAWLLLQTPEVLFQEAIPWLLLAATALFISGGNINASLKRLSTRHQHASAFGALLLGLILAGVCIYGGFFNAGLGIISLSYLVLAGYTNINAMNGMKLLISFVVSLVAITLFIYDGVIAWQEGIIVLVGSLAGGYVAAHISKRLSQQYVRAFVIVAS